MIVGEQDKATARKKTSNKKNVLTLQHKLANIMTSGKNCEVTVTSRKFKELVGIYGKELFNNCISVAVFVVWSPFWRSGRNR